MRVNGTQMQSLVSSAYALQSNESELAAEMSSGIRITHLSDDPAAVAQAGAIAQTLASQDTFLSTANTVTARMQASDSALGSVVTQLTSAISITTGAVNGTDSASELQAAAEQLSGIRDSVLSLSNSSYNGFPLFGGTSAAATPFSLSAGVVSYAGDTGSTSIRTDSGTRLATSLPGSEVFTAAGSANVFTALGNAITAVQSGGPFTSAQQTTLVDDLHSALQNVIGQRAILNASQSRINMETNFTSTEEAQTKAAQSTLLSADPAQLATQLSADETQRSALLSTIAIVQKGSLFDYIQG